MLSTLVTGAHGTATLLDRQIGGHGGRVAALSGHVQRAPTDGDADIELLLACDQVGTELLELARPDWSTQANCVAAASLRLTRKACR